MTQRLALVTGGTGGIGSAICRRLADHGYRVASPYRASRKDKATRWQEQARADGYEFTLVEGDVADFDACQKMVQELTQELGPVHILVNCAGITRDATLRKMEKEQWDAVVSTNLDSVFNVTRAVINGMLESGFGRVINISSVNGQKGQFGQTNYSAAKAGMHGFTMALAQEVAKKGITVNTVSPGYIGTEMVAGVPEEVLNKIVAQVPVGRLGQPEEVADLVAFLARDESGYITGANLAVNGGLHMH
ncbi:MAG: beta-ketoacyl-ACP reductase [Gammaproteobacteria bacterium]|nr:beta-ketoacyl-ACP reductase [Gammaproteobacteria bacterium]NIR84579.1 beta-ketoacyl-ACP reductase [Gammaproteobacteria bacterium]NIR90482.1 beta-ketoacyl-ACP reductase [Gammaproteobacteria bacterium]NIU05630.1 beta-ketoacyl-ACP reductase [Gammaproteobacteria bacterium]NIV52769.1 acetoacetyl-CoA reductase [Gammaproteobacteria bacterium]